MAPLGLLDLFLRQNPAPRRSDRARLDAMIEEFSKEFPAYATAAGASFRCWEASAAFLARLAGHFPCFIRRVCFCRERPEWTRCAGRAHSHLAADYPFAHARTSGGASSHQYVAVFLRSEALGVDFTARQFVADAPFPLVWRLA